MFEINMLGTSDQLIVVVALFLGKLKHKDSNEQEIRNTRAHVQKMICQSLTSKN